MTHELNELSEIMAEQPGVYPDIEERMEKIRNSKHSFLQGKYRYEIDLGIN